MMASNLFPSPDTSAAMELFMSQPVLISCIRDKVETLSPHGMRALQVERLRAVVHRLSQAVPFYRDKLAHLAPDTIHTLDDLARLPFTTKTDLRDNYPFNLLTVPMDDVVRIHVSNDTTVNPAVGAYTRRDIELWSSLMARSYSCAGATPRDIIHNAFDYGLFTGGLGFHYGAETLGATVIPVSGASPQRQVTLLRDFGSTFLCCTPSHALVLADTAEKAGIDLRSLPLKVGIFGAELWSESMRSEIESRLGIVALNVYGLSEIIGPGVACECLAKQGMHIAEDHFIPEIIDPITGARLHDGEEGELVLTCITKEALPLIRYRTGHRTRLTRGHCACGRTTVRMNTLASRNDELNHREASRPLSYVDSL
jgi:phenylacetate-CoA ligase